MIQKAYALFGIMLVPQIYVVYKLAEVNTTIKCRVKMPLDAIRIDPNCQKEDPYHVYFSQLGYFYFSIFGASFSVYLMTRNKINFRPLNWYVRYPAWLGETASLCYMSGFIAAKVEDSRIVLLAEIVAMSLALIGMFLGGKLINMVYSRIWQSLSTIFVVLSFLLTIAILATSQLKIAGMQFTSTLIFWTIAAMAFMIFDTQIILDGRYFQITVDDTIFVSMKLFADFVLLFGLLTSLLMDYAQ